jgi:calcineurin-like phosphoesterase family protein
MAAIWFSSDHHFRHTNTWEKFKRRDGSPLRPFTSTKEMDERMIEEHNSRVRPQDHWYCLGDISMMRPRFVREQIGKLNGHKRLVRGNHDIYKTKEYLEVGFEEIYGTRHIDGVCFSHFPVHPRSVGRYFGNVHGHIHEGPNLPPAEWTVPESRPGTGQDRIVCPYLNITVEHTDYKPLSLEEIKAELKRMKEAVLAQAEGDATYATS